jgi:RNA polymerase sigma-70 factor (ECF subfamily)
MSSPHGGGWHERIADVYRAESRPVLATLIRLLGDFDEAEEAVQDAFTAAARQWPRDGMPANPRAWLVSTGRFRAIDRFRRRARFDAALAQLAPLHEPVTAEIEPELLDDDVADDRLRLIFTCCHPTLTLDAQVAMTLREVCGLTTEQIASSFVTSAPTVAQRIVRAKAKIRIEEIPYEVPTGAELAARLDAVLHVVYLVFNEGYSASSGTSITRIDLAEEAIRLGRLIAGILPEPEVFGLVALMLLNHARRGARVDAAGDLVLLPDQDRRRWDHELVAEAAPLLERARAGDSVGHYTLQAAIAAVHATASTGDATDWDRIVELYDLLLVASPSSVVALNRAVAVAMRDGPSDGLALVDAVMADGDLDRYHLAHAARADLLRRLDRTADARDAYRRALELAEQEPERRFLRRRLDELSPP